jgi:hypothetical protein
MGRGNDGTGWSMSIWPRRPPDGQDRKHYPHGTLQIARRTRQRTPKAAALDDRTDEQKLEDGLTKMMKSRAKAKAYIARKKRKESK